MKRYRAAFHNDPHFPNVYRKVFVVRTRDGEVVNHYGSCRYDGTADCQFSRALADARTEAEYLNGDRPLKGE